MSNVIIRGDIDNRIEEIKSILPPSVSIDSFNRAANIAVTQTPGLSEATADSVFNSLSKCAADGLVPDGREAALVVFSKNIGTKQSPNWVKAAQYLPMVDGVLKRARLSGQVSKISSKVVYENDSFEYWIDEHGEHFKHVPSFGNRGELRLVYASATVNGELCMETMDLADINRVKAASKGSDYGPWKDWFDRMALKSVLHRLARRLPNASELVQMLEVGTEMNFKNKDQQVKDITPEFNPYVRITEIIAERGSDEVKMLGWASKGVKRELDCIEDLSEEEANKIVKLLEAKK